jgi:inner membrane protein
MDNVTHALAGMLLAEAVVQLITPETQRPKPGFRRAAWLASAVANNFPDLDFVYGGLTPGKLGYLLHHRGHTHTLLVATLLGVLTFFGVRWLARRLRASLDRREEQAILGLSLAGGWIHIGMDLSNNYGVHPFWPLHDGWFYGDAIFIIEPWFWLLTVPPLLLAAQRRAARIALGLVPMLGIVLAWITSFAGFGTALSLTLGGALSAFAAYRLSPRTRALAALAASLLVVVVFSTASRLAAAKVRSAEAGLRVPAFDFVTTPAPANPLCWNVISIGQHERIYELRVATVSIAPGLVKASACGVDPPGVTAALRRSDLPDVEGVAWQGVWRAPLPELRTLARERCDVAAFLRYARVPFWLERPAGELVVGDLRYDRGPGAEFAELELPAKIGACPRWVPPWIPPRSDVLAPAR